MDAGRAAPEVPVKKAHEQPGGFQAVPRAGVGLSLAAVRWQLWLRIVPAADHWLAWKRDHAWTALVCHY